MAYGFKNTKEKAAMHVSFKPYTANGASYADATMNFSASVMDQMVDFGAGGSAYIAGCDMIIFRCSQNGGTQSKQLITRDILLPGIDDTEAETENGQSIGVYDTINTDGERLSVMLWIKKVSGVYKLSGSCIRYGITGSISVDITAFGWNNEG